MQASLARVRDDVTLPPNRPANELMSKAAVLEFFGGDKPIHESTLYRGIAAGRYPAGIHISPNVVRWRRTECQAALDRIIAERDGRPKPANA